MVIMVLRKLIWILCGVMLLCGVSSCYIPRDQKEIKPYLSLEQFLSQMETNLAVHRDEYLAVQWISADSFLRVVVVPQIGLRRSVRRLPYSVLDTLSLGSVWSLLDPNFVIGGKAYLLDVDSTWYQCFLGGRIEELPHSIMPDDPMIPLLSSSVSLTVFYLGNPDLGLLVYYDQETKELRVYRTCDPYGEVPIDSLLEEYYFKSLRQGSYSRGVDIRNQKMGPPVYIE